MRDDAYLETAVLTASPQRLHLMVLDGALRHARRAEAALESGDAAAARLDLGDGRACGGELISGLDPRHDSGLVENVKALFVFAYRKLALAELERNVRHLRDGLKVLELHRETWLQLMEATRAAEPPRPVPAPHIGEAQSRVWEA